MAKWILAGVNQLVKEPDTQSTIKPTQVKVKVSYALVTDYDTMVYCGKIPTEYPRILGRAAVGIVTEVGENCYGLEKGTRVYIKPTHHCDDCLQCLSGKKRNCGDIKVAGKDFDGALRDFLVCEYNSVAALPSAMDDIRSLCIEYVGMAENIYDKLHLSAGQRVAVIGAGFMGNIIAQVLIYHKVIPIIVDNEAEDLIKAKTGGAYFAYPADEDLHDRVYNVTCGDMCDAVVYCGDCNLPVDLALTLAGNRKTVILCSQSDLKFELNVNAVIAKDLTIKSVSNAYTYTDAVINMMINNAVNFDMFERRILTDFDPAKLFAERANALFGEGVDNFAAARDDKMTILKLIM